MNNRATMKVLWIIVILLVVLAVVWHRAYAGSPREIYEKNRTLQNPTRSSKASRHMKSQRETHIGPIIRPSKRRSKTYRKCYNVETGERLSCPKRVKTTERVRHD